MTERFEVQARLQRRHEGRVVHDESRHASTDNVEDARRAASMLAADGFTVWIFEVTLDGSRPTYRSLEMMRPNGNEPIAETSPEVLSPERSTHQQ